MGVTGRLLKMYFSAFCCCCLFQIVNLGLSLSFTRQGEQYLALELCETPWDVGNYFGECWNI